MPITDLIDAVAREFRIPDLEGSGSNTACLQVDGNRLIMIEDSPEESEAHLYCRLADLTALSPSRQAPLFRTLLEAQLFGGRIGDGQSFGLDSDNGELFLNRRVHIEELNPDTFITMVRELINWSGYWIEEIERLLAEGTGSSGSEPVPDQSIRL